MTLDRTQTIVKNKLGMSNSQMIGYKIIYDFIARFAHAGEFDGEKYTVYDIKFQDKSGHLNKVPLGTMDIIESIGLDRIGFYFSMDAYPKKFESFCRKMFEARAQPKDYVVSGVLVYDKIVSNEFTYEE
ncbi:MAG: hypothetical protein PVI43_01770 [Candidatus Bathyarchaeota archaeon]|jgi:hypothetical protein